MAIDWTKVRLKPVSSVRSLALSRPVPLRAFSTIKTVYDRTKPFQYIVQVQTRHKRTGEDIFRQITVTESERGNLEGILQDASDAIVNSPIASREEFVGAEIIRAQRFKG
ncbi:MAG TPA: hypothetical protein VIY48_04750 [Candidatus Paceibacterota bacterium]